MIYVDNYNAKFRNFIMCHMMADTEEELDTMAKKIGLKKGWKHHDHYDVSLSKKKLAIQNGAIEITCREMGLKSLELKKKRKSNA